MAHNLPACAVNRKLSYLARLRAQDMADHRKLTHYSPTYGTPSGMETTAGIRARFLGAENIVWALNVDAGGQSLFHSPRYRANLLDPRVTELGLGVVHDHHGVWVSQLFLGHSLPVSSFLPRAARNRLETPAK